MKIDYILNLLHPHHAKDSLYRETRRGNGLVWDDNLLLIFHGAETVLGGGGANAPIHPQKNEILQAFPFECLCTCRLMGTGIFTMTDTEKWKARRQLYDPAFKKR